MIIVSKENSPEQYAIQLKRIKTFGLIILFGPILWLLIMGLDAIVMYIIKRYKQSPATPYRPLEGRRPRIKKAPGSLFLKVVDFFYSSKTVENTFLPLVADWRTEYFEALMKGRKWKACWISIRYRYSFIQVVGSEIVSAVIKILKGIR